MRLHLFRVSIFTAFAVVCAAAFAVSFATNPYPTGTLPQSVVSADIDRDGHPDLISADANGNYITVLLGSASGAFTTGGNIPTAGQPAKLVGGDFNHDGYPDIAVMEPTAFQIFLSAHNGTLTPMAPQAIPKYSYDIVAVDLNGDHIPDLAITRCTSTCSLETWVDNGSAVFTEKQGVSIGFTFMTGLVAADFDRDGHDDLAVAFDDSVQIFHSNNNGSVTLRQTITMPDNFHSGSLAAGDIDARNGADLVVAGFPSCVPTDCIQNPWAHVYLNSGSGNLVFKAKYDMSVPAIEQVLLVDLTGDNRLDIVGLNSALQMNNGSLVWAHYAGGGTFSSFSTIQQLGWPTQMIARDLNLDSRLDLAITDRGFGDVGIQPGTYVLLNTGSGAYCGSPNSSVISAELCFIGHTGDTYTFEATGNSPIGVRRMELWIDGKKVYNSPDDRLKFTTTLSSGTHKTVIVAVDQFEGKAHLTNYVTAP